PGKLYFFDLDNEVVIKGDMVARIHDIPVIHYRIGFSRAISFPLHIEGLPSPDFAMKSGSAIPPYWLVKILDYKIKTHAEGMPTLRGRAYRSLAILEGSVSPDS